ncbi:histidinol-phosphate transaminase [Agromyces aerolatus]|uniref:histidinol-phosphate transaminase n=1 Tax=Agromyces sp. LY-1074 TaxID=3074080 RepID=UPI0028646986|nr:MULTISPECIES: histidinol-phosphate transaminase [unclassified Agromyces]MDR5699348.1 histidinol-phosphate transaminase [Agromyces sp. LY-1074]MDR5705644.1 histidinol-phosphate transaminase [Agromyces sp. LY-1358]
MTASDPTPARVRLRPEIAALPAYRQGRPAPADGFKLSSNENPFDPLPSVRQAVADAAGTINRYPDASALALRERLGEIYGVGADEVLVGAGSVSLLAQLIQAAAGPGDEVVYAWRSFEAYPGLVTVSGATSVQVPNRADHGHELDDMAAAVTDRTRVVIVCSPNNPTGVVVTADEFEAFMRRVPADLLVLLDEAYIEFVRDEAAVDGRELIGRYPNLVILRTFSKAYGLAGLRVGYAIGPVAVLDAARSTAIPLGVTAASTAGALASLEPAAEAELLERVNTIVERRDRLREALIADGWPVPAAQGNFLWLPTGEATETTAEALWSAGVVARPFPGDGIRVSVGEESSVQVVIDVLATLERPAAR